MKHLRFWIGLAIGVLFVWLIVRALDLGELFESLQGIRYVLVIPSLALAFLSFVVRAYRWRYLFAEGAEIPYRKLYTSMMIGFMGNAVLPARAGEFIRAYVISKTRQGLPASKAFATIVAERIFDGLVLAALLCFTLLVLPSNEPLTFIGGSVSISLGWLAGTAIGIMAAAALVAGVIYLRRDFVAAAARRIVAVFSERAGHRVSEMVASFASGFEVVRDKKRLVTVGLLSLLVWAPVVLSIYPLLRALPGEVAWPWYTSIVVVTVVCLGVMIPGAPAFAGTFHAACVAALFLCARVDLESAAAFSVVYWGANTVGVIAMGVICLWMERLSFVDLARRAERSSN